MSITKKLVNKIILRTTVSTIFAYLTVFLTGKLADTAVFLGRESAAGNTAVGFRTELTSRIFSVFPNFGHIIFTLVFLIAISSTILIIFTDQFVNRKNHIEWNFLLYMPCLLIYASSPSKEFLFFLASLPYILIECEGIAKKYSLKRESNFLTFLILKISLLFFMVLIRAEFAYPYCISAIIFLASRYVNLNIFNIQKINLNKLIIYSFFISIVFIFFVNFQNPYYFQEIAFRLNRGFNSTSVLSRVYDYSIVNNILNPFTFIKVQYLSFFPSINELLYKPHSIIIVIDSLIFIFLFLRVWKNLFKTIKGDNVAKNIFVTLFLSITCSYFLLYGITGYSNLGSAQRFKANFVPIAIILPLVAETIFSRNKSRAKESY